jgi:membrane protein DedA with SNARE-associated domain
VTQNLVSLITQYGLLIVTANVFMDQIGLPVPALLTLILAGALATSAFGLSSLFAAAVLACIVPDCIWFLVGRRYGIRVLKTLCRISLEPDSCVTQTQSRFERWGVNSLMISKFVPDLAVIAPPLAGAMRIAWPRFLGLSAIGGSIWVGSGLAVGMLFQTQIQLVLVHLDRVGGVTGTVVAAALLGYVFYKWRERQRFYKELRMARISVGDLNGSWKRESSQSSLTYARTPPATSNHAAYRARFTCRWTMRAGISGSCAAIVRSSSIAPARARRPRHASPSCL